MKWSAERYARLYTRDTPNWVAGPWQARALLPLVVRKLDRSGLMDLSDNGIDGLSAVVLLPVDVVEVGLAWWLKKGTLVMRESVLVMPNFVEAQECVADGALRSANWRDRKRYVTSPPRDATSPKVTIGDVTRQAVTARDSVLCCAVPNQPERESARAPDPMEPEITSETRMVVAVAAVRPTLAPIPRQIDPAIKLTDEARATAEMRGLRDVDNVWISFVGHCIGRGVLSCDFIAGDWPKWVTKELAIQRKERDRDASSPRAFGSSRRSQSDENYTPPPVSRRSKPELARSDFERIGVSLEQAGIDDDAPSFGTAKTHPRRRAV